MTDFISRFVEGFASIVLMVFLLAWQVAFAAIPVFLILWALDWLGFISVF